MIILGHTTSKVQVVTGAAVAAIVSHASFIDINQSTLAVVAPDETNTSISTATTTDVVAAPASGYSRNLKFLNVRNTNASTSCAVTIQHTDGTTVAPLWYGILGPGMQVQINELAQVSVFSAGGILLGPLSSGSLFNASTSTVSAGYASDTYLAGSSILIPAQRPRVGTRYRCYFDMTKTAAGTATPIVTLRYGTAGSVSDTALATFTFGAGTAAADTGIFYLDCIYRSVGSGTSAVIAGNVSLTSNLSTTGLSNAVKARVATSSSHDSTTANTYLGVSFNGGTSFSGTCTFVAAELLNL